MEGLSTFSLVQVSRSCFCCACLLIVAVVGKGREDGVLRESVCQIILLIFTLGCYCYVQLMVQPLLYLSISQFVPRANALLAS